MINFSSRRSPASTPTSTGNRSTRMNPSNTSLWRTPSPMAISACWMYNVPNLIIRPPIATEARSRRSTRCSTHFTRISTTIAWRPSSTRRCRPSVNSTQPSCVSSRKTMRLRVAVDTRGAGNHQAQQRPTALCRSVLTSRTANRTT